MDMHKWFRWLVGSRAPLVDRDALLDFKIHEALVDYALVQPPAGAWDRLVKTITERGLIKGYGMWVLDEPLRDPPDVQPTWLNGHQYRRAERLYNDRHGNAVYRARDAVISNLFPTFPMLFNL
jgi:hypothetical protein